MADRYDLYVGTYSKGAAAGGIYRFDFDATTGRLAPKGATNDLDNPTFLALHPDGRSLYAANEIGNFEGKPAGAASAYRIEPDGALTRLNRQASAGRGPCYVSVEPTGRALLIANYGSGSVACLPIGADGSLAEASTFVQHEGSGPNPGRQEGPHAHFIQPDPSGRFALACDLGTDEVRIYRLDAAAGRLEFHAAAKLHPGAGPRHLAFHPSGRFAYVANELDSTVTAFTWSAETGELTPFEKSSTLPPDFKETNYPAHILVHPSGRTLYLSNRGHDSIAIFNIAADGRLEARGHASTGGATPRHFALDPEGRYLLAENQESGSIVVFRVARDGGLEPTGMQVDVPKPVCIVMRAR